MATAIGIAIWLRFDLPTDPSAPWWKTPDLLSDPRGIAAWIAGFVGTVVAAVAASSIGRRRANG
jgi:hypothetical protein